MRTPASVAWLATHSVVTSTLGTAYAAILPPWRPKADHLVRDASLSSTALTRLLRIGIHGRPYRARLADPSRLRQGVRSVRLPPPRKASADRRSLGGGGQPDLSHTAGPDPPPLDGNIAFRMTGEVDRYRQRTSGSRAL